MIHIIALGLSPLRIKLHDAVYSITKITHDNGDLTEFECDPPNEELRQMIASNLQDNPDLSHYKLDQAVARANKRGPKK